MYLLPLQALTSRIEASVEKTKGAQKSLESATAAPGANEKSEGSWTRFDMEEGGEPKEAAAEQPSLLEDEEDLLGLRQPISESAAFGDKESALVDTEAAPAEPEPAQANGNSEAALLAGLGEASEDAPKGDLMSDIDSFLGISNEKPKAKEEPASKPVEKAEGDFGFGDPEASLFDDKDSGFATRR